MLLWVNSMPDKCSVFNCWLNFDNGPEETGFFFPNEKKIRILDSVGLDLWTEKAGNRRRNAYVERILNRSITKRAQGKRDRFVKKLKRVPTLFDPEESHLSAESKYLKSPVSVPRTCHQRKEFINKISLNYLKNRTKSKVLMTLILR